MTDIFDDRDKVSKALSERVLKEFSKKKASKEEIVNFIRIQLKELYQTNLEEAR